MQHSIGQEQFGFAGASGQLDAIAIELNVQDIVSGDMAKASGKFNMALVSIASM